LGADPDTKDNLEALVLGGGKNVLGSVTLGARVGADNSRETLQAVEVGLVVASRLASAISVLVSQGETQSTASGDNGRRSGQNEWQEARNTHGDKCELNLERKSVKK